MISSDTAEIIRRKKSQYCRFADSNQWERFKDISLPDATFVFVDPTDTVINTNGVDYQFASRETFLAFFSQAFRNLQTIHMVDPGDLEQTNADEVKAVWSVIYHAGPKGLAQGAHEVGGGHYYEVWSTEFLKGEHLRWGLISQVYEPASYLVLTMIISAAQAWINFYEKINCQ
ncbi:hypothetical protein HFD88_002754 [Aspergillus terreus]|nr:hypothetical protein HFD88_002754 [Aspergillus terreus]